MTDGRFEEETGDSAVAEAASPRRTALKLGVSAILVAGLAALIDPRDALAALRRVHPGTAALCLAIYLSGQVVSALRWRIAVREAGFVAPAGRIVRIYLGAMFFNLFGPSTLGGDGARTWALLAIQPEKDLRGKLGLAVSTVAFDRICGLAVLLAVPAASMLLLGTFGWPTPIGVAAAVSAAGCVALPALAAGPLARSRWLPRSVADRLSGPGAALWRRPSLWARVAAASLVLHLHQIVIAMLLLRDLELPVPELSAFVFHPLVLSSGAIPVGFFGIGVREIGYVWALSTIAGASEAGALGFGLAWSALLVAAALSGGIFVATGSLGGGAPEERAASE